MVSPISSSPQPRPSSAGVLAHKGKDAALVVRPSPPSFVARDPGSRPFVPAPRAMSRPVQTTDSGLKDRDVAIGLARSVVLEKDKTLAGAVSIPEIGSILQSLAYQVIFISAFDFVLISPVLILIHHSLCRSLAFTRVQ